MSAERKVVWVLGAGFSQGLGGPLLKHLFRRGSVGDVSVRYSHFGKLSGPAVDRVRVLYELGSTNEMVRPFVTGNEVQGELLWEDAEQFIDYLDTAAEPQKTGGTPQPLFDRLRLLQHKHFDGAEDINDLRTAARRLIAAECSAFLEGVDVEQERWEPFRAWERELGADDTIVTFNYDRVVEKLRVARPASKVEIIRPGSPDDLKNARDGKRCVLLKLHGSVDWKLVGGDKGHVEVMDKEPLFALDCPAAEIAIATPGPSKKRLTKHGSAFWDLWAEAKRAIGEASAVVFLGFRFPETDAAARR